MLISATKAESFAALLCHYGVVDGGNFDCCMIHVWRGGIRRGQSDTKAVVQTEKARVAFVLFYKGKSEFSGD